MRFTSEPASRDFVSSFEQEEYEVAKFLSMSGGPEDDDDDEDDEEEEGNVEDIPELPDDKDIFDDDDEDEPYVKDYF